MKTNIRKLIVSSAICAVLGASAPAFALVVQFDNFLINRNGALFFQDTFSDGVPPPNGPVGATTYGTQGIVSEAGGKVILNTALGVLGGDLRNQGQFVTRLTDISSDMTLGLKSDDT